MTKLLGSAHSGRGFMVRSLSGTLTSARAEVLGMASRAIAVRLRAGHYRKLEVGDQLALCPLLLLARGALGAR